MHATLWHPVTHLYLGDRLDPHFQYAYHKLTLASLVGHHGSDAGTQRIRHLRDGNARRLSSLGLRLRRFLWVRLDAPIMLLVLARLLWCFPGLLLSPFPPLPAPTDFIILFAAVPVHVLLLSSLLLPRCLAPVITCFRAPASHVLAPPLAPTIFPAVTPAGRD